MWVLFPAGANLVPVTATVVVVRRALLFVNPSLASLRLIPWLMVLAGLIFAARWSARRYFYENQSEGRDCKPNTHRPTRLRSPEEAYRIDTCWHTFCVRCNLNQQTVLADRALRLSF